MKLKNFLLIFRKIFFRIDSVYVVFSSNETLKGKELTTFKRNDSNRQLIQIEGKQNLIKYFML